MFSFYLFSSFSLSFFINLNRKIDDNYVPKIILNIVVPFIYGAEKYSASAEQFFRIVAVCV
jgi:hypothetical protein